MALLNCETVRGAYEYPGIEVFGVATLLWDSAGTTNAMRAEHNRRVARNIRGSHPKSGIMNLSFS